LTPAMRNSSTTACRNCPTGSSSAAGAANCTYPTPVYAPSPIVTPVVAPIPPPVATPVATPLPPYNGPVLQIKQFAAADTNCSGPFNLTTLPDPFCVQRAVGIYGSGSCTSAGLFNAAGCGDASCTAAFCQSLPAVPAGTCFPDPTGANLIVVCPNAVIPPLPPGPVVPVPPAGPTVVIEVYDSADTTCTGTSISVTYSDPFCVLIGVGLYGTGACNADGTLSAAQCTDSACLVCSAAFPIPAGTCVQGTPGGNYTKNLCPVAPQPPQPPPGPGPIPPPSAPNVQPPSGPASSTTVPSPSGNRTSPTPLRTPTNGTRTPTKRITSASSISIALLAVVAAVLAALI
jgi:hypothetical protein